MAESVSLMKERQVARRRERDLRVAFAGTSHVSEEICPYRLFPRGYTACKGSYRAHVTKFFEEHTIAYVIEYKMKPDVIVLIFGGNDIAFRKSKVPPPTNSQIEYAIVQTAKEINLSGIMVVIVPIMNRTNTDYYLTNITPGEYNIRRQIINEEVRAATTNLLGYNPVIEDRNRELTDGIHLSRQAYIETFEDIENKIREIAPIFKARNEKITRDLQDSLRIGERARCKREERERRLVEITAKEKARKEREEAERYERMDPLEKRDFKRKQYMDKLEEEEKELERRRKAEAQWQKEMEDKAEERHREKQREEQEKQRRELERRTEDTTRRTEVNREYQFNNREQDQEKCNEIQRSREIVMERQNTNPFNPFNHPNQQLGNKRGNLQQGNQTGHRLESIRCYRCSAVTYINEPQQLSIQERMGELLEELYRLHLLQKQGH